MNYKDEDEGGKDEIKRRPVNSTVGLHRMMNVHSQTPPPNRKVSKKSVLIPLGIVLILLGLLAPRPLSQAASNMEPGTLRSIAFISTDVLRVCFFGGIVCVIIGVLRSRKK